LLGRLAAAEIVCSSKLKIFFDDRSAQIGNHLIDESEQCLGVGEKYLHPDPGIPGTARKSPDLSAACCA